MLGKKYDVIIAGASFAGLSVASRLECKVLLIDRKEIGTNQTSACGTFMSTFNNFRTTKIKRSILQIFTKAKLHTKDKTFTFNLIDPLTTIDYYKFCNYIREDLNAVFLKANVTSYKNKTVKTTKGDFKAKIIVDATGWSAVLASSVKNNFVNRNMLDSGIETVVDYQSEYIHFFADPSIIKEGVAWIFPIGDKSRFGVAYYHNKGNLKPVLDKFLSRYNLKANRVYGGLIPFGLRSPVVEDIFLVGDAGGQVLPLTAEGIRKAVINGTYLGELIQKVLENKIPFEVAKRNYKEFILKKRFYYKVLLKSQRRFVKASNIELNLIPSILQNRLIASIALKKYLKF
jgi:flavin-dependent dehydrogenase